MSISGKRKLQDMVKTISILGSGWLGLALAKELVKQRYVVLGSSTSDSKAASDRIRSVGASPYKIALTPDINSNYDQEFFRSDLIILAFPPRRVDNIEDLYPAQITSILSAISRNPNGETPKILFVSSTSVYPDGIGDVDENCLLQPSTPSGVAILTAEEVIRNSFFKSTILRLGGLIGYDRDPSLFLESGKIVTRSGEARVNLIHRDDAIGIIKSIIEKKYWRTTLNGVSPDHPTRRLFYTAAAKNRGLALPCFIDDHNRKNNSKVVSSKRLIDDLGYSFIYRSPLDYITRQKQ